VEAGGILRRHVEGSSHQIIQVSLFFNNMIYHELILQPKASHYSLVIY